MRKPYERPKFRRGQEIDNFPTSDRTPDEEARWAEDMRLYGGRTNFDKSLREVYSMTLSDYLTGGKK